MLAAKGKLYAKMDIKIKPYNKAPRPAHLFRTVEPVVHTRLDYFSRRTRWRDVCVRPPARARCLLPARCLLRCWCSPRPRDHRRCGAYRLAISGRKRTKTFTYPATEPTRPSKRLKQVRGVRDPRASRALGAVRSAREGRRWTNQTNS